MTAERLVFGVGLPRTGTSSLTVAMARLGYTVQHYFTKAQWERLIGSVEFASDMPVSARVPLLVARYPEAKFILTVRDPDAWLPSIERLIEMRGWSKTNDWADRRQETFGDHDFEPVLWRRKFLQHKRRTIRLLREYRKPSEYLIFDMFRDPEPWSTLVRFLGFDVRPAEDFPHENRRR